VATLATLALVCLGCGQSKSQNGNAAPSVPSYAIHARPQAIEPVAGAAAQGAAGPAAVSVESASGSGSNGLAQPVSLDVIRRELTQSGTAATAGRATMTPDGLAVPPLNAPAKVVAMIEAGNQIAHLPYRFGGGHGTFQDTAYDCSGSLSYVFWTAGILNATVTSGQLMSMGQPGPGKWVTVYANQGHTFAIIAGLRFDTVALAETGSRWSSRPPDEPDLASFVIRHPTGG